MSQTALFIMFWIASFPFWLAQQSAGGIKKASHEIVQIFRPLKEKTKTVVHERCTPGSDYDACPGGMKLTYIEEQK